MWFRTSPPSPFFPLMLLDFYGISLFMLDSPFSPFPLFFCCFFFSPIPTKEEGDMLNSGALIFSSPDYEGSRKPRAPPSPPSFISRYLPRPMDKIRWTGLQWPFFPPFFFPCYVPLGENRWVPPPPCSFLFFLPVGTP